MPRKPKKIAPTTDPTSNAAAEPVPPEAESHQHHEHPPAEPPAHSHELHVPPASPGTPTDAVTLHGVKPAHPTDQFKDWTEAQTTLFTMSLTKDRYGPTATIARDRQFKQIAISFSRKPLPPKDDPAGERKYLDMLDAAGYGWRGKERVWTKQLDKARPAASQLEEEEFFHKLVDLIRTDHGHGPAHFVA